MSDIHFIITGGTIDKSYDPPTEIPQPNSETIVPDYLENKVCLEINMHFEQICLLDSNDINGEIRGQILEAVKTSSHEHIIIVHGTSAMTVTADYLHENLDKNSGKTIILTGAMIPLKEFAMSDGGFNLGYAMAQVQNLTPGVYICMNGKSFPAGSVTKNVEQARFEDKA